ncbi:alpha/beta hydrolase fold domain-containing protein [Citreimonas sp.]|uniref:alpha/beta hydrolase fold domain-containing protein n=1 Tax=Citreimonas sp. TaxID=3036715 RepID=UPI0040594293
MQRRVQSESELRALIESTDMDGDASAQRSAFVRLAGPQPPLSEIDRGGVSCGAIGEGPEIIWFHGGGYVFGSPETHAILARMLAAHGFRVILPAYRRAPEHPWPSMLLDALSVVDASGDAILAGDSAGGHLALSVALRRRVKGLALVSPNTDRTGLSTTRVRDGDIMNDDDSDTRLFRTAMPATAKDDTDASPLLADLKCLPPLHLEAAGAEILLDDTLLLARRAALAGVRTTLHVSPGLFHMFTLWPDVLIDGAAAIGRIAAFAREHAGTARSAA